MIHVAIDGVVYAMQRNGGISRMFNEVIPRMCNEAPDLRISLFTSKPYRQSLPVHPQIHQIALTPRNLRPSRVWQIVRPHIDRVIFQHSVANTMIWHSTYFTPPPHKNMRAIVGTFYDTIYERFAGLYQLPGEAALRQRQKYAAETADICICISQTTAQDVHETYGIPLDKLRIVSLACNPIFRKLTSEVVQPHPLTGKQFLLYVGGRRKHKNFAAFLGGYSRWASRDTVYLAVVGEAWTAEEKTMLDELGVAKNVQLITNVSDDLLVTLYNQAAAFVYPSLWEGFGIPLLEAINCNCPIVASHIPSTVEVAGDYPFYFELSDVESLHHALDNVLINGCDLDRLQMGIQRASIYTWDKTSKEVLNVYRELA